MDGKSIKDFPDVCNMLEADGYLFYELSKCDYYNKLTNGVWTAYVVAFDRPNIVEIQEWLQFHRGDGLKEKISIKMN